MDRFRVVLVLVAVSLTAAPSPAAANHIAGATYNGTYGAPAAGTVSFTVTPDGSGVSSFSFRPSGFYGPCDSTGGTKNYVIPLPIVRQGSGHYFNDTTPSMTVVGAFSGPQGANGTFKKTVNNFHGYGTCVAEEPWTATTTASAPGSSPPKLPSPGTTGPTVLLSGKTIQKARSSMTVGVFCPSEACTATAGGTINVPGASKVYRLKGASANVLKGGRAQLKLKVPGKARRAIKRALRRKKKVRAKVTVTARNAAGNNTTRKLSIRLKR